MKSNIVIPAWEIAKEANSIKKFNFLPSLLSTLYLSAIVLYQISYTYIIFFQKKDEFFSLVINFAHQSYFIEIIIGVIIGLISYLLLKPIAEAGIVSMIDGITKNESNKARVSYGISEGLLNFLPLFEFHNFMGMFKLLSILTFYFLLLRIFGSDYALIISIMMFIYFLFALLINVLFAYTKFFIIFEKKHVFEAISMSTHMTLQNMEITGKLYYTLFLMYARVILTLIVFTIFPLIFSFLFAFFTSQILFTISMIIVSIILILFFVFVAHFNSVLEIFIDALWYNAYIENKKNMTSENIEE